MNRLEIGDVVKTSYGTGPYRISKIDRDCRCATTHEEEDGIFEIPPHLHLVVFELEPRANCQSDRPCFLNYYDENTLKSVRSEDFLTPIITGQWVQSTLF